jgi:transposase-like protein
MNKTTTTTLNGQVTPTEPPLLPAPEALPKAKRRTFTTAYKQRIVREADACSQPGEVGALLRREGLYSSHLAEWRKQIAAGGLPGSQTRKRGRKAKLTPEQKVNARLQRENERLKEQLAQAELIIAAQKKVAELLGLMAEQHTGRQR